MQIKPTDGEPPGDQARDGGKDKILNQFQRRTRPSAQTGDEQVDCNIAAGQVTVREEGEDRDAAPKPDRFEVADNRGVEQARPATLTTVRPTMARSTSPPATAKALASRSSTRRIGP